MSLLRRVSVLMRHISVIDHPVLRPIRSGLQNPDMVKHVSRVLLSVFGKRRRFSLIELLIAVSIIVTFSSLVGAVYLKKLEESKLSKAKIDINTIANSPRTTMIWPILSSDDTDLVMVSFNVKLAMAAAISRLPRIFGWECKSLP